MLRRWRGAARHPRRSATTGRRKPCPRSASQEGAIPLPRPSSGCRRCSRSGPSGGAQGEVCQELAISLKCFPSGSSGALSGMLKATRDTDTAEPAGRAARSWRGCSRGRPATARADGPAGRSGCQAPDPKAPRAPQVAGSPHAGGCYDAHRRSPTRRPWPGSGRADHAGAGGVVTAEAGGPAAGGLPEERTTSGERRAWPRWSRPWGIGARGARRSRAIRRRQPCGARRRRSGEAHGPGAKRRGSGRRWRKPDKKTPEVAAMVVRLHSIGRPPRRERRPGRRRRVRGSRRGCALAVLHAGGEGVPPLHACTTLGGPSRHTHSLSGCRRRSESARHHPTAGEEARPTEFFAFSRSPRSSSAHLGDRDGDRLARA